MDLPADLRWELNYTYLDARNRTAGQRLGDRSRHLANSQLRWSPNARFSAQLRTGIRRQPGGLQQQRRLRLAGLQPGTWS